MTAVANSTRTTINATIIKAIIKAIVTGNHVGHTKLFQPLNTKF